MKIKKIDEFERVSEVINECIHPVTTEIENLEDGEYEGYRYEYWFELKNGFKFKTKTGVRVSRKFAALKLYKVENGEITEVI